MASTKDILADLELSRLHDDHAGLRRKLGRLRQIYFRVSAEESQKCSQSLNELIHIFFQVVSFVNKADKSFVNLTQQNVGIKTILRSVGLERRVNNKIAQKTEQVKAHIAQLEESFSKSQETLNGSIASVQELNFDLIDFSHSSVEKTRTKAAILHDQLSDKNNGLALELSSFQTSHKILHEDFELAGEEARAIQDLRTTAEQASTSSTAGAVITGLGCGIAILNFYLMPAAALATVSVGLWQASKQYETKAIELGQQQVEADTIVTDLKSQMEVLMTQLKPMETEQSHCEEAMRIANSLLESFQQLRIEALKMKSELFSAQMLLCKLQIKLNAMVGELQECDYARTRREIASKLREIAEPLIGVSKDSRFNLEESQVAEAIAGLVEIESRTPEMLRFLAPQTP